MDATAQEVRSLLAGLGFVPGTGFSRETWTTGDFWVVFGAADRVPPPADHYYLVGDGPYAIAPMIAAWNKACVDDAWESATYDPACD